MAAAASKALSILAIAALALSFLSTLVLAQDAPAPAPLPQNSAMPGALASPLAAGLLTSAVLLFLGSIRH